MNNSVNRILYGAFLLLGLFQGLVQKDYIQAATSLGIGLAFDPFNLEQRWGDRPIWQKMVLFANLGLAAAMLGFGIGYNDR